MRVLVPLPFDVSNLAHGRNLRVVHLLRGLHSLCDLTCLTANDSLAEAARAALPDVLVVPATHGPHTPKDHDAKPEPSRRVRITGSFWIRRALSFLGYDQDLLVETVRRAKRSEVVLGFDMPSVVYLLAVSNRSASRVCDLIDDPWLLRRSFPRRQRWSMAGIKSALSTRILRDQVLGTFDALTAVARLDADSLSRVTGRPVAVIPNGVEVQGDAPPAAEREPLVVFTGSMDFPANETAPRYLVNQVWPRVRRILASQTLNTEQNPFKLAIVGANPSRRVLSLAEQPGVMVTGWVQNVSAWLKRARVAVAPMTSGCGIKNKVLEACAAGCPVVTTPLGAAGLPIGLETGILVGDSPADLAAQTARVLTNASLADAVGAAGRAMVRERYSWRASAEQLLQVLSTAGRGITAAPNLRRKESPLECEIPWAADHQARPDREVLIHAAS